LDDFIAVRWLFADQFEDDQADVALAEETAASAEQTKMAMRAAATGITIVLRAGTGIRLETHRKLLAIVG
ncbi:MAG: hypothetical protein ACREDH_10740, partial [Methylocella sp.]